MNPELKALLLKIVSGINQIRGVISESLSEEQDKLLEDMIQSIQNAEISDRETEQTDFAGLDARLKALESASAAAPIDTSLFASAADLSALTGRVQTIEDADGAGTSTDADGIAGQLSDSSSGSVAVDPTSTSSTSTSGSDTEAPPSDGAGSSSGDSTSGSATDTTSSPTSSTDGSPSDSGQTDAPPSDTQTGDTSALPSDPSATATVDPSGDGSSTSSPADPSAPDAPPAGDPGSAGDGPSE